MNQMHSVELRPRMISSLAGSGSEMTARIGPFSWHVNGVRSMIPETPKAVTSVFLSGLRVQIH